MSPIQLSWTAKNIAGSMETKWKYKCKKWKIHISVDFPQLTLGRWQVSAELMDAPSGSNRKAHNPDLADMGRVHRPSFVISNHNSMSRLSLSNPPSAMIFIVLKVDASSCFIFVNKNEYLVKIYGSIFGRSPGPWNTILPPNGFLSVTSLTK